MSARRTASTRALTVAFVGLLAGCSGPRSRYDGSAPLGPALAPLPAAPTAFVGTATGRYGAYEIRTIAGTSVLVNDDVLAHPAEANAALAILEANLAEARRLFGPERMGRLALVRIWVEWRAKDRETRPRGPAEFHPSRVWLTQNGYDPEKERNVEINDTERYIAASRGDQPMAILHELAHAYDFVALGGNDKEVHAAFDAARASHAYDSVNRVDGSGAQRAYALVDSREYFAETTEAWFGTNDFYPFVHEQLRTHDPRGYALMARVWGTPPVRPPASTVPCGPSLVSAKGAVSSAIVVTNETSAPVVLTWVDESGRRAPMSQSIVPNATYAQQTFAGHVFVITTPSGQCLTAVQGGQRPTALRLR